MKTIYDSRILFKLCIDLHSQRKETSLLELLIFGQWSGEMIKALVITADKIRVFGGGNYSQYHEHPATSRRILEI